MITAPTQALSLDQLLPEASRHTYTLFKEKLPNYIHFHTYQHTIEVAKAADRIGRKAGLNDEAVALVTLAAWFHDTGFTETYDGHEEASVRLATAYLESRGAPDAWITQVGALIRATHPEHKPQTLSEQVLRDADLIHVGKKEKFFRYAERLRKEWAHQRGGPYTDQEWAEVQLDFLTSMRFETAYAEKRYGATRASHLEAVQRQLAALLDAAKPIPALGTRTELPRRGVETMFRTAYRNHINLSSIADSKANIMISINAILMSVIVSFVSTRFQTDPWLLIPSASMLLTSLAAIVFAILSARPKVTSKVFSLEDVRKSRANILFFGNFVNLTQDRFRLGIREMMRDWDMLYDSMINDIYGLGLVLMKKYRLLWLSFTVFMAGLIVTVALFLILFVAT